MERLIKHVAKHKQLDLTKWIKSIEVASWPKIHKIINKVQTDGASCGLWLINFMEYWTGASLSDNVTQNDISNFRFKLPAILYNSPLNGARGLPDNGQQIETPENSHDDVTMLDELDILMSGSIELTRTIKWRSRKDLLSTIYLNIRMITNSESLDKEWVRSTRPYPICLSPRKIINILDENIEMDHDCFNMAIWMVVWNQAIMLNKQNYHFMDLKFAEITRFGRDIRCSGPVDHKKLPKVLERWPDMQYDIKDCSNILLPYYQDGLYTLYIMDMENKIVHIMDPLPDIVCSRGYDQSMAYIPTFHTIAKRFGLAMGKTNSKWNDNIYHWKRKYPTCVTKVPNNKYWNLGGFLIYNFMKFWDGVRLPPINNLSISLRMEFLADILTSPANECFDNLPEDLQYMIKELGRM